MIMRQEKIQLIRKALVKKMEEIWSNSDDTIFKMRNAEGKHADPFDLAAVETNKFVELVCRDRERQLLLDIKETIMRIDRGLFGYCDHCGRIIHARRLLVEPLSRHCTECQEKRETSGGRKGRQQSVRRFSFNHPS